MKIKRANGTMLILVVAFMLILIVFCMATLAMVTVANNRAVTKFEENQSYYTAASALEVFANGSLSDNVYYATGASGTRKYETPSGGTPADMTQGRALELDLYKISVLREAGTPTNPIGAGEKGTVEIFDGTSYSNLNAIINADLDKYFGTTANNFTKQFTSNDSYKYAEYTVLLPSVSSGDDYGLFADKQTTGTGTSATNYHAKIKVEVLERYYNMQGVEQAAIKEYMQAALAGTITDAQATAVKAIFGTTGWNASSPKDSVPNPTAIEDAIKAGERHKDYFRIRVSSEAELLGVKGVTAREYVVSTPMPGGGNMAITNFGYSESGAALPTIGGISSLVSTGVSYVSVAGSIFSGGSLLFNAFNAGDKVIAEDTVSAAIATPFMTALDIINFNNAPSNFKAQGYNTIFYAANGIYALTNAVTFSGNDANHAFHFITERELKTANPITITGTLTCDTVDTGTHLLTINKAGTNYGNLYVNELNAFKFYTGAYEEYEIRVAAAGGTYTKDLVLPNDVNFFSNKYDAAEAGTRDDPVTLRIRSNLSYSGLIRTEDGSRTFTISAGGSTGYQIKETGGTAYEIDLEGYTITKLPNKDKEPQVSYYYDTDGNGRADYTMNAEYQKEIKLPFELKDSSGATLTNKLTVETARSLYHEYFGTGAIWGSGMGVDNHPIATGGDGLVDSDPILGSRANGGDGSLLGFDTDGVAGMDKPLFYGVLDGGTATSNWTPKPTATYNVNDNSGGNISTYIGYAKTGDATYGGVMDCVLTAAQRLLNVDNKGDGTTLNILTDEAPIDNTGGNYLVMVSYYGGGTYSGSIDYDGTITGSGIIPDSAYLRPDQGSRVLLVDTTLGGDINLQLPLSAASASNNLMLVKTGAGKLNIIIPENTGATTRTINFGNGSDGQYNKSNAFVVTTMENYVMTGMTTTTWTSAEWDNPPNKTYRLAGKANDSPTLHYTTGSNADKPTDAGKITIYVGKGNQLDFKAGTFLNGILYAPQSLVNFNPSGDLSPASNAYYNPDASNLSDSEILIKNHIVGNVVCSGFKTGNHVGVTFLPAEVKPEDGKPNFSWNVLRYLSGQN